MKRISVLALLLCLFALPALADLQQDGSGYYLIANADDLRAFADMVNDGNTGIDGKLTTNITLSGTWTPIGNENRKYAGSFDGQGYSVSKVSVDSDALYAGLFGYTDSGAAISNLTVNADIFVSNSEDGADAFIGGIVGYNGSGATVSNCTVKGSVKGAAKNYGTEVRIGGIAGINSGTITDCTNYAKVTAYVRFNPSVDSLSVYAGGIASGNSGGSIKKCSNHGDVDAVDEIKNENARVYAGGIVASLTGGSASDCYNTADVYSGSMNSDSRDTVYAGGIAGFVSLNRTVTNCYSTGSTSGSTYGATTRFGAIVGSVATKDKVTNCYHTKNRSGIGYGEGTTIKVTSDQMKSGEVAYLLDSDSSDSPWGQDLDNGKTVQTTPNFTGAKVYRFTNCAGTIVYSNTQGVDGAHKWTYTADGAMITQSCDYGCGQGGSVTLKAAENLVYDGTKKENVFTTEGAFVGIATPAIDCDDEIINAGTYTATLTVEGATATIEAKIAQSATIMTAGANKGEYTYGEHMTISVTAAATGTAAFSLRRFAAPQEGEVALYNGETQITAAQTAGNGETVTFTLDTVADGLTPGSHTLTAKYTESDSMAAQEASVSFAVSFAEDTPENDAVVSGDKNEAGWHRADPTLIATEGSTISHGFGPDAQWNDSLTLPTEEGEHTYTYYVKDESGLISEKTVTVMVDKNPPIVERIDIQTGVNGAKITAAATDACSGVLDYSLTQNTGKEKLTITNNGSGRFTIEGMLPGNSYDLTLIVRDKVGHQTAVTFTVTAAYLPQTGDDSMLGAWMALLAMAGAMMLRRRARN